VSITAAVALIYLLGAATASTAAAATWRRRRAPGAAPLALMLAASALWALCDAVDLQVATVGGHQLVSQIQYLGVISAAPFFFHGAMELAGSPLPLTPRVLALVWGVPLLSLAAAWTNPWHGWLWTNIALPSGELPFATYQYGWWFWVLAVQHYLLVLTGTVALLRAMPRVQRQFRVGMTAVLVAVIVPWVGNIAYNLKLGPLPGVNYLTLSLILSGSLFAWAVLREGLLDVLPRAREALLDRLADGVIVFDHKSEVLYANDAARQMLSPDAEKLASLLGFASIGTAPRQWRSEVRVPTGDEAERRWLDVSIEPVRDRWGALAGRVLIARDVTLQKTFEDEREHLVDELQQALQQVTQLQGLLPMCAHCRNVRVDRGYWTSLDDYLSHHAPIEFTHAICPDCARRLHPS
jgi:PAS domain-containing protein